MSKITSEIQNVEHLSHEFSIDFAHLKSPMYMTCSHSQAIRMLSSIMGTLKIIQVAKLRPVASGKTLKTHTKVDLFSLTNKKNILSLPVEDSEESEVGAGSSDGSGAADVGRVSNGHVVADGVSVVLAVDLLSVPQTRYSNLIIFPSQN
jgi:hypothetical protein